MNKILLVILLTVFGNTLYGHPWKPVHNVIIDTDCGFDDYRTICMLLAAPDIKVLGIVTSDGVLDAQTGYYKLRSLLLDLHHEGILTGASSYSRGKTDDCLSAKAFEWRSDTGGRAGGGRIRVPAHSDDAAVPLKVEQVTGDSSGQTKRSLMKCRRPLP